MGGMGDLVPLIVVAGIGYYVLVVNPSILSNLTPAAAAAPTPVAPVSGASTTTTATTPCQGKDPSGNPCACPATGAAGFLYSYKSSKSKSSNNKSSNNKSSTPACDCSACSGTSSSTTTSNLESTIKNAMNKQINIKSNTIKNNAGFADLNSYAGASMANEGYGFNSLQAYHRRKW
jgi:hypothetical protein